MRPFLILAWLASVAASPATDDARRALAANDDARAFSRLTAASRGDDPDAVALLGWMYDTGRGVARDQAQAAQLYSRVVEDNPNVQWRLGVMYDLGQGVRENPQQAVRLFRQAANANFANGAASLAVMYANGRGVRADYALAMRYYRRAAELGSSAGFLGVGMLYHYGLGVPQSRTEAANWYLAAYAMRDTRARQMIGYLGLDREQTISAVARANQLLINMRRPERVANPPA